MSELALREQLRVARSLKLGLEIEPHEVEAVIEDLEADHQALLELEATLSVVRGRVDRLRRAIPFFFLCTFLLIGALHVSGL